nr:hypothetical protein [uncultured Allomuricauda sp.]
MRCLKNNQSLLPIVLMLMHISCQNEETPLVTLESSAEKVDRQAVVLGKELEIPYTAKNMQTAFDNLLLNLKNNSKNSKLAKTFKVEKAVEIIPSHYYYRFLPKDSLEHERIIQDTVLQVSNIPLHFAIEEEGDFYDDPELEGDGTLDGFSYLYAVVPYDYNMPEDIERERLDNFYFAPEMDDKDVLEEGEIAVKQPLNKTTKDILTVDDSGEVFEYLELEALKLTNNLEEEELDALRFFLPNDSTATKYTYQEASQMGFMQKDLIIDLTSVETMLVQEEMASRRRWRPSGRITVQEDAVNRSVGVAGAEVKVRKWGMLVIRRARTDQNGNFKTRRTRTKRVKYAVHFNSPQRFRVMAGSIFVRAKHRGTRRYKRRAWNQHFSYGRGKFYALVHNAAYDYYTRVVPRYRLSRPRYCTISAKYNRDVSSEHRPAINILYSDLRVTRIRNGRYRGSDGVYATTVHELTHAGHREMDPGIFSVLARSCRRNILMESWAEGVETVVTNDRYNKLQPGFYSDLQNLGWNSDIQRQKATAMDEYSPIVIDLVDNFNQNVRDSKWPVDKVNGYTLQQIQSALKGSRYPNTWRNKLNSIRPNGVSTAELNILFKYMDQIPQNPQTCK